MPAPNIFGDGLLNPLPIHSRFEPIPYNGILIATDRSPATEDDVESFCLNCRGQLLRIGVAAARLGDKIFAGNQAWLILMLKAHTEKHPVKVAQVDDWGVLLRKQLKISPRRLEPNLVSRFVR